MKCQKNKADSHTRQTKLLPMPRGEQPFEEIAMHFVCESPQSEGFNAILVVRDRFTRYSTTFQQKPPAPQQILRTHAGTRFAGFTDFLHISLVTVDLHLPPSSHRSLTANCISTYDSQSPTTLRQMDSANDQSRHSNSTSASTAMMGKSVGADDYLLPNLRTTPDLPPPMNTLPTTPRMATTLVQYTSKMTMNSPPPWLKNGKTE